MQLLFCGGTTFILYTTFHNAYCLNVTLQAVLFCLSNSGSPAFILSLYTTFPNTYCLKVTLLAIVLFLSNRGGTTFTGGSISLALLRL